jgi:hypothetical protein
MRRAGTVSVSGAILFALLCIALIFLTSNPAGAQQSEGANSGDGSRQRAADNEGTDSADNGTRTDEDLADLSCDELLALFRGEGSSGQQYGAGSGSRQQYGDATIFADADVRARIEVCLEREIVAGTGIDEDLPDTGGVSLLALAVLGMVSVAAGLSVIRGGRR